MHQFKLCMILLLILSGCDLPDSKLFDNNRSLNLNSDVEEISAYNLFRVLPSDHVITLNVNGSKVNIFRVTDKEKSTSRIEDAWNLRYKYVFKDSQSKSWKSVEFVVKQSMNSSGIDEKEVVKYIRGLLVHGLSFRQKGVS